MPTEIVLAAITAALAAVAAITFLWIHGAGLIAALEIHRLRVDAHQLRIDYARRIRELTGEEDPEINVDIIDDEAPTEQPLTTTPTPDPSPERTSTTPRPAPAPPQTQPARRAA